MKVYADRAAEAAARQEQLRDTMRGMDDLRAGGRDVFGSINRDLTHGTSAANTFANALGRIVDRLAGLTADSLTDIVFGKRGSSDLGLFGGLSGGGFGGILGGIGSLFGFANGGIITSGGPLPLRAYSAGGIADSPQLALYGEGRMPEVYVPLPDGRRIPVAMQGGGAANGNGGASSVTEIDARMTIRAPGADAAALANLRAYVDERDRQLPQRIRELQRRAG